MGRSFPTTRPVPRQIVNFFSDGGVAPHAQPQQTGKRISSGALVANTYKPILTISGAGAIKYLTVISLDGTSRQLGIKLTLDDNVVFQAIGNASTSSTKGIVAVGSIADELYFGSPELVYFNRSCIISVSSTISETDKIAAVVSYEVY